MKIDFSRLLGLTIIAFLFSALGSFGMIFESSGQRISYGIGMIIGSLVFGFAIEIIVQILFALVKVVRGKYDA